MVDGNRNDSPKSKTEARPLRPPYFWSAVLLSIGGCFLLLLNGQVFTNALIFLGFATASGLLWIRYVVRRGEDATSRFGERVLLAHFVVLIAVVVGLPEKYRWQTAFNRKVNNVIQELPAFETEVKTDHEVFQFENEFDRHETPFRVDWPPKNPADHRALRSPPLLAGWVMLTTGALSSHPQINVRIKLTRADGESDRVRWNRDLKFPEYDWMSRVRTWDADEQWLWPNLPFLLKAHGVEREQRYGGIDPGKGIDNDFAAVVVRPLDANANEPPLITADWHPSNGELVDKHSVVHSALSGDLQWSIPESKNRGELGIWLIYADFLNFQPPESWPTEPEYDGGILAYFDVKWRRVDSKKNAEIITCEHVVPQRSTGVDWRRWARLNQRGG